MCLGPPSPDDGSVGRAKKRHTEREDPGDEVELGCLVTKSARSEESFPSTNGLIICVRNANKSIVLPRLKFCNKTLSFQEVFEDVYCRANLDIRVTCRVGFKKPGNVEPKHFVEVDLNLQSDQFSFFSLSQKVELVGQWETKHFMGMAFCLCLHHMCEPAYSVNRDLVSVHHATSSSL